MENNNRKTHMSSINGEKRKIKNKHLMLHLSHSGQQGNDSLKRRYSPLHDFGNKVIGAEVCKGRWVIEFAFDVCDVDQINFQGGQ